MSKSKFTPEQQELLRANPFTHRVTSCQISFTKEFKEEFWRRYTEKRMAPADIMTSLGYSPEILGITRISGIQKHIRDEFRANRCFSHGRKICLEGLEPLPPQTEPSVERLQHELLYLRQEIEFLKKISFIRATKK